MLISKAEREVIRGQCTEPDRTLMMEMTVMVMIRHFHLQGLGSFLYSSFAFWEVFIMSDCRTVTTFFVTVHFNSHAAALSVCSSRCLYLWIYVGSQARGPHIRVPIGHLLSSVTLLTCSADHKLGNRSQAAHTSQLTKILMFKHLVHLSKQMTNDYLHYR